MATISVTKALTNFFNVDPVKLPAKEWVAELRKLTPDDKAELAQGVCAITGDTLGS